MPKRYIGIIITYILAQFSAFAVILVAQLQNFSAGFTQQLLIYWQVGSFIIALIVSLFLLRRERELPRDPDSVDLPLTIIWSIAGVFLAFFGQVVANVIQQLLFNVTEQSQNTLEIMAIAFNYPVFIIVVSVIGPILEELVFRKVIFGELNKRTNFLIAALISSLIFAVVHTDFTHLLVYFMMGLVFSFLYVQTKRIIVPIFAHVAMNSIVVMVQFAYQSPELQELLEQFEQLQIIIFGG
ncbi:peptidase [Halolactibacillus alkaliphilus]|uniref:Peptidase n=1 Tax=Halolactibacillus alkaliphilus TaxID=442899 RepID=A0A511X484_9BACI|nr:type II CAAX endopeptidase family protein [Halolactibacillus alkaliphilus]GEN57758.1 peptidase [Halolactibacillus alkaliphilus]GGN74962.1 peptidase [Halolactibacillus alkaliphilus]SFP03988.1 hypothetical protein SAMN05720591_13613 [Halolactibacillus alkaliphilus]